MSPGVTVMQTQCKADYLNHIRVSPVWLQATIHVKPEFTSLKDKIKKN